MLKKLVLVAVLFTSIVACNSNKKAAFNYSEEITKKDASLEPIVSATEDRVGRYLNAGQFDSVAVAGEEMEKIVQTKIDEINAMKVPGAKGAEEFKAATIRYFKFIKSLYTGYKRLGLAKDQEEREAVVADLQKLVGEKTTVLSEMQAEQRKFASDNGFKIK